MKAIVYHKSGPAEVLQLKEIAKPVPGDNEILVKIHASTVTRGDILLRKLPRIIMVPLGLLFGFKAKYISGTEFAGIVESAGKGVRLFKPGDRVFGTSTGLKTGGNAEYICLPEKWKNGVVTSLPGNIDFGEAAAMPVGFMTAIHLFNKANIVRGSRVLIYGASGSVGTYAVQLAKYYGAEVTGVCSSANIELVKSIGADFVLDYTKEDFSKNGIAYDIIFDAVGKIRRSACRQSLSKNGSYISVKSPTKEKTEYLEFLKTLVNDGKIRAVIDRTYTLGQVAEAHMYVESGRKKGNVVIRIEN